MGQNGISGSAQFLGELIFHCYHHLTSVERTLTQISRVKNAPHGFIKGLLVNGLVFRGSTIQCPIQNQPMRLQQLQRAVAEQLHTILQETIAWQDESKDLDFIADRTHELVQAHKNPNDRIVTLTLILLLAAPYLQTKSAVNVEQTEIAWQAHPDELSRIGYEFWAILNSPLLDSEDLADALIQELDRHPNDPGMRKTIAILALQAQEAGDQDQQGNPLTATLKRLVSEYREQQASDGDTVPDQPPPSLQPEKS